MINENCGSPSNVTPDKTNGDFIPMDWTLETPEERTAKVNEIVANTTSERLTPRYI